MGRCCGKKLAVSVYSTSSRPLITSTIRLIIIVSAEAGTWEYITLLSGPVGLVVTQCVAAYTIDAPSALRDELHRLVVHRQGLQHLPFGK